VHDFEKEFLHELHTSHQHDVLDILKTGTINDDIRKKLEETAKQLTMNQCKVIPSRIPHLKDRLRWRKVCLHKGVCVRLASGYDGASLKIPFSWLR